MYTTEKRYSANYKRNDATFLFWTLIVFIFILAIGNLILTLVILGVLRLGQGMQSLELLSEENLIKFYGTADLGVIYQKTGHIDGFSDIPLEITGEGASVNMKTNLDAELPSIEVGIKSTKIKSDSFDVNDPKSGQTIFSTDYPNFGLPRGVKVLNIQHANTKRISSPVDQNLQVESSSFMKFKGTEGTSLNGQEVVWSADQDIYLKSVNKSIILSGNDGIYIDIERLPIVRMDENGHGKYKSDRRQSKNQFKICVCMPSGKLFRVPVITGDSASCYLVGVPNQAHPCI